MKEDLNFVLKYGFLSFPKIILEMKDNLGLKDEDIGRMVMEYNDGNTETLNKVLSKIFSKSNINDESAVCKMECPLTDVFDETERMMGRLLSPGEINRITSWKEDYHLSPEAILILISYCLHREKCHMNYMEAVAKNWFHKKIITGYDALKEIEGLKERKIRYDRISKLLRLNRQLTLPEEELYDKWMDQWGFDEKIILEACKETTKINSPSFKYLDKILEDWHSQGVKTSETLEKNRQMKKKNSPKKRSSITNFPNDNYNDNYFKELEKKLTGLGSKE